MVKMLQMEVVMCGMNHLRLHFELRECLYVILFDQFSNNMIRWLNELWKTP
jgi:hypothetical protein